MKCFLFFALAATAFAAPITTVEDLTAATTSAGEGSIIELAAGTFALTQTLDLPGGVTLKGAGIGKTILLPADSWSADPAGLPDPEMRLEGLDTSAYLIRIQRDTKGAVLSDLTLHCPRLHGAIFSWFHTGLRLSRLHIKDSQWCGVRSFGMQQAKIHDCIFENAGIRWEAGKPGLKGGITGGGIFACWMADTEIYNNRFLETRTAPHEHYYGIKGRQAKRCRIHHNTIHAGFSIELPFEGDEDVEIDHNVLRSAVSIPKHAGGNIPKSGRTFHIHHNYFRESYSIEFPRNGIEIDHNLFDFDPQQDGGNLIASFGGVPTPGPASFHHNYVSNPGRGVVWIEAPYAQLNVHHNHIIARTTKTPRTEGLFDVNGKSDFKTHRYTDNIIECEGTPRPLFRNEMMDDAVVENNQLVNITDTARYRNKMTGQPIGPGSLKFECGVNGEMKVDGWKAKSAKL